MDVTLVTVEGSKKLQSVKLRAEETIIGRRNGCDLRIPAPGVSRRHCRLSFHEDLLTVEDLASANGTFLNGQRLAQPEIARPGDRIGVGPVTFLIEYVLTPEAQARLDALPPLVEVEEIPEMEAAILEEDDSPEAIVIDEEVDDNETIRGADDETGTEFDLRRAGRGGKRHVATEETADASAVMRDWELPAGGDLRDLLEKLGDGNKD